MGQKVNPIGYRLGISKEWQAKWIAKFNHEDFAHKLVEDEKVRKYMIKHYKDASISKIEMTRTTDSLTVILHTAKPGVVIGRKGENLEKIRLELLKNVVDSKKTLNVKIMIKEIKNRYLDAKLVGESISAAILSRSNYKKAVKKGIENSIKAGAKGIKIRISGRLGGAEMARNEMYSEGQLPLSTLKADIDYAVTEAITTLGIIGIKVWIYRGDVEE